MKCRDARRWMSPYLDSELGATKTFEISEHVSHCAECNERFEKERRVDQLLAERLRAAPAMDWSRIQRRALTRRSRAIRWRIGALAMAACLVFALLLVRGPGGFFGPSPDEWAASQFVSASPDNTPFPAVAAADVALASLSQETLGVPLTLVRSAETTGNHDVQLVQVNRRTTPDGTTYLEIRLNCCGEPMLVFAARQEDAGQLGAIARSVEPGAGLVLKDLDNVHLGARGDGQVVVVAASRHTVAQVVRAIRVG